MALADVDPTVAASNLQPKEYAALSAVDSIPVGIPCGITSGDSAVPSGTIWGSIGSTPSPFYDPHYKPKCNAGHVLTEIVLEGEEGGSVHRCDMCSRRGIREGRIYRCEICDYDLCRQCAKFKQKVGQWASDVTSTCTGRSVGSEIPVGGRLDFLPSPPTEERPEGNATIPMCSPVKCINSRQPAVWVPDECTLNCQCCGSYFNLLRRRHHCRACGHCVCDNCSLARVPVPDMGYTEPVRCCNDCVDVQEVGGMDDTREEAESEMSIPTESSQGKRRLRLTQHTLEKRQQELALLGEC